MVPAESLLSLFSFISALNSPRIWRSQAVSFTFCPTPLQALAVPKMGMMMLTYTNPPLLLPCRNHHGYVETRELASWCRESLGLASCEANLLTALLSADSDAQPVTFSQFESDILHCVEGMDSVMR